MAVATTSTHACAFCASTDEGVGGGRREVCRKPGWQHLDAQKLRRGVLTNARRGTTGVEAVARTREKARSRAIDGVAPKLAAGTAGDGAGDRATVEVWVASTGCCSAWLDKSERGEWRMEAVMAWLSGWGQLGPDRTGGSAT
jgi:hypothetical protein